MISSMVAPPAGPAKIAHDCDSYVVGWYRIYFVHRNQTQNDLGGGQLRTDVSFWQYRMVPAYARGIDMECSHNT